MGVPNPQSLLTSSPTRTELAPENRQLPTPTQPTTKEPQPDIAPTACP